MGTGGSRYGAGRPGWRRKCEQKNWLDIRQLHRRGRLTAGQYYSWSWSRGDEPAGSISIRTAHDYLQLIYSWTPYNSDPQSMDYQVWIERTPCNYGGTRPWFRCPRCQRQCAVIYGVASDGHFGCRHCMRLAYSSEAEGSLDRLWRKQRKLERHLIEGEITPKGMHSRTYERIIDRINCVEEQKDVCFFAQLAPFMLRTGMRPEDLFK